MNDIHTTITFQMSLVGARNYEQARSELVVVSPGAILVGARLSPFPEHWVRGKGCALLWFLLKHPVHKIARAYTVLIIGRDGKWNGVYFTSKMRHIIAWTEYSGFDQTPWCSTAKQSQPN